MGLSMSALSNADVLYPIVIIVSVLLLIILFLVVRSNLCRKREENDPITSVSEEINNNVGNNAGNNVESVGSKPAVREFVPEVNYHPPRVQSIPDLFEDYTMPQLTSSNFINKAEKSVMNCVNDTNDGKSTAIQNQSDHGISHLHLRSHSKCTVNIESISQFSRPSIRSSLRVNELELQRPSVKRSDSKVSVDISELSIEKEEKGNS